MQNIGIALAAAGYAATRHAYLGGLKSLPRLELVNLSIGFRSFHPANPGIECAYYWAAYRSTR